MFTIMKSIHFNCLYDFINSIIVIPLLVFSLRNCFIDSLMLIKMIIVKYVLNEVINISL